MAKTRVLVVEDSTTVRRRIIDILCSDPGIEVIGEAEDGKRAIEICQYERPDVITMDMMLPVMSGLSATEYIMAHCPTPILVVSASLNRGELFKIYEALAAGAVDVLEKPLGDEVDGAWERRLIAAVKLVAKIRVITHPRARLTGLERVPSERNHAAQPHLGNLSSSTPGRCGILDSRLSRGMTVGGANSTQTDYTSPGYAPGAQTCERQPGHRAVPRRDYAIVAIGASTGGPGAIVEVLRGLPAAFRLPVLVVLHINEPFGTVFAEWLDERIERRVRCADDGVPVASLVGGVAVAPAGRHMVVCDGRLRLTADRERHSCRPSVDVLFESVAAAYGASAAACLLTGMGRDGAQGLLRIREAGGMTIAQDESTSVVYGMPREAVLLNAAIEVLPLGDIGPRLAALQATSSSGARLEVRS
jgi:two-component system, chemotaxis family, protein-glutamate methylesterase/glutaminase